MPILKNIQFTHLIKIHGNLKEFNFRKPNGKLESNFTVDVIDDRANRIIFNMNKSGDSYKIVQSLLPTWILDNEEALNEAIQRKLNGFEIYVPATKHYSNKQFSWFFSMWA